MDDRLQQRTERGKHYEHMTNWRECVETTTLGSAQERVYQQRLHRPIVQKHYKVSTGENVHSLMQEDDEGNANWIEIKDLQIYDSLEADAHPCYKKSPTLLHTDSQKSASEGGR